MTRTIDPLLTPFVHGAIRLRNRFVMAPMTRSRSSDGVPSPEMAEYYRKRAVGGVGLIISEGVYLSHPTSGWTSSVPDFATDEAKDGWRRILGAVHAEGTAMYCQLWHEGVVRQSHKVKRYPEVESVGPSGIGLAGEALGRTMTADDIDAVVTAYVSDAVAARELGFDGIEFHGAHGYLLDQFMWDRTNYREDEYADPVAFPARVVAATREAVGADFPIVYRFSQWKVDNYDAQLAQTPGALKVILDALLAAGVDVLHASTRRFWDAAFPALDQQLTLAGWAKRLTGAPVIAVGSVGLDKVFIGSQQAAATHAANTTNLDSLVEFFEAGEFDLIAVGRALLSDPDFVRKHAAGKSAEVASYDPLHRTQLI